MPKNVAIERPMLTTALKEQIFTGAAVSEHIGRWQEWSQAQRFSLPAFDPRWLEVLNKSMGHDAYVIEQSSDGIVSGLLPLMHMKSRLFGGFLVGLPYVNVGGVWRGEGCEPSSLIDEAVKLADSLAVRHLELRHEIAIPNAAINQQIDSKVHMRLELPERSAELWDSLKPKVRNQVRKAKKCGVEVVWGRHELLDAFYKVFAQNMRDLGTPVFSKRLFVEILNEFEDSSELCVATYEGRPAAAAIVVHGNGMTEVPSASSIRGLNSTCANMKLYWHLLERSIERGQAQFDFGRSTLDSQTYRFKKQWGAVPNPACWQFYVRNGSIHSMRPEAGRYSFAIRIWRRLPLGVANLLGPLIIRGVP